MTEVAVLIVDDHPVVRSGLRAALEADPELRVAAEAGTGEEALRLLAEVAVDVVLMDLHLGAGMDGAEATGRIRDRPGGPRVLVLTAYDSESDILRAIEAGAAGYLLKDAEPAELRGAVRTAARGETVLAPSIASRLVARVRTPARSLTPRETEVVRMVAEGYGNREIARRLFITEATVKSHLVQVFGKLGVDNRTAAGAEARRRGIIR